MRTNHLFYYPKRLAELALLLFIISFTTLAQTSMERAPAFNKKNIEPFLDSLITKLMDEQHIAGCGITIVKDSGIIFSKGYGFSDLKNKKPFDPKKTLFRTASVSKVVIATVLMHLKEKGLIDFNKDINTYLKKFKVENKFGKPITVANLLTHTPGFDDFYIGKSARTEKEAIPLGEFLEKYLPERITPPGEVLMYSNMGMALAAFLVEEITGKDFEQYAIENLFLPLEMNKSSFRIKEEFKDDIYKGYVYLNGEQVEFSFDFINDYPAGQMLTTLDEFSNFMLMQLHNGKFNGKQIVDSALIKEIQSVQFTHNPKLHSAVGYAFMIDKFDGKKLLWHDGGYPGILTRLRLFPERDLGLFIAINGYNSSLNDVVSNELMYKFFPYTQPESNTKYPLIELPSYDKNVDKFIGNYRSARYSRNEIAKIGVLMGMVGYELPIWKNDEGMLIMYDFNGKERRLIQVEPLLFQSIDDDYFIKFREDQSGNVTHLFTDGISSLEKIPFVYTIKFQQNVFVIITTLFALILFAGLIRTIINKIRKSRNKKSILFKLAERISSVYLFYLLAFGLIMYVFINPLEQMIGFPYGIPWYFYLLQIFPIVFILLSIWFLFKFLNEVKKKNIKRIPTVLYSIFFITCLTTIWFLNYWNLIGFKF